MQIPLSGGALILEGAISLFSSEDIRRDFLPPAFHVGGMLLFQSPAKLSSAALLE